MDTSRTLRPQCFWLTELKLGTNRYRGTVVTTRAAIGLARFGHSMYHEWRDSLTENRRDLSYGQQRECFVYQGRGTARRGALS